MRRTCFLMCLILSASAPTQGQTDPQLAKPTESDVVALLEQLPPSRIVVDGDPIATTTLAELMREHQAPGVS